MSSDPTDDVDGAQPASERATTSPYAADPTAEVDEEMIQGELAPRRRTEPRAQASFRVQYDTVDELVEAYTVDVSRGGLYIETTRFLPLGAVVRLHLSLPEEGPELRAVARVAYVLNSDQAQSHERPPGMGMEFLEVGGTPLADEIARFVARISPDVEIPPSPAGLSARVLVVDDDIWHRERAAQVMRDSGFSVLTADNGIKALQIIMQTAPDMIVTDVEMPVMDGWQLVRMVRSRPTLAQIPIIFVTALSSDEQRLQGYRLGVDDYVAKPFDEDELALRAQRVLTRAYAYPRNTTVTRALRGSLGHVSLASLMAFVEVERRTGMLLLVDSDRIATVYIREGNVVRVDLPPDLDELHGAERMHQLLGWTSGRFEVADADVADIDTIGESTSSILLAHAQRLAEARRG